MADDEITQLGFLGDEHNNTNASSNCRNGSSEEKSPYTFVETPAIVLKILEDVSSSDEEEETNDLEDSIGRFIWPAAAPMLRHLLLSDNNSTKANYLNKTCSVIIVELGAGCGVLGMGLAAATPNNHVILTDHDSDWLQRNLALNEPTLLLREDEEDGSTLTTIEVAKLDWREPEDITTVRNMIDEKLASLSKSNNDELELMIVGSDILYNHESHKSLVSTLYQLSHQLLRPIPIRILLGFPDRDDDEQHFMPIARERFRDDDTLIPPSQPIIDNRKKSSSKRGKKMDLRIIEFSVNHS